MNNIFISYRRDDSKDVSGRIYDHLVRNFTKKSIFKDLECIPIGVDFREFIVDSVISCEVMLVIIGRKWESITNDAGERRIECKDDYVRIEIETALENKIQIIPVLVSDAKLPFPEDLPDTIENICYKNAISIRHDPDFNNDISRLVKSLKNLPAHKRRRNIKVIKATTVLLSMLIAITLYLYFIKEPNPIEYEEPVVEVIPKKPVKPVIPKLLNYYIDNTDGTITDTSRNLMWERCSVGQEQKGGSCKGETEVYSWDYVNNIISEKNNYNDWRLPTREELREFISVNNSSNVINTLFPYSSERYWTSEEFYIGSEDEYAYVFDLITKKDTGEEKHEKNNIRLVRRVK
jgi:hypothetical protein